ncbi:hypothetical protein IL308_09775 [Lactococcus lactis]|uniref:hypothetical protein n=1 Tax=Lactococcus lactis TaxID=1358 RepID=UPI00191155C3|nr:hypothetical protein [Lactococcus lactis]MBK5077046.1 hypothetical protein [Lactococcus lactis]
MKFTIDTKVNLAFGLSLLVFLYTLAKDAYNRYHARFRMETNIVEWIKQHDRATNVDITMMRVQLINKSNSPIIVSHIDIKDKEKHLMKSSDFSHIMFFRKIDEENYKEAIKTSQFPVTIVPHSGENLCLFLKGENGQVNFMQKTTRILLYTNKGQKSLRPKRVEPQEQNIQFFS